MDILMVESTLVVLLVSLLIIAYVWEFIDKRRGAVKISRRQYTKFKERSLDEGLSILEHGKHRA